MTTRTNWVKMFTRNDMDIERFARTIGLNVDELVLALNQPISPTERRTRPDTEEARMWTFCRPRTP